MTAADFPDNYDYDERPRADDTQDFYEAEVLGAAQEKPARYAPDDFTYNEEKGYPRHQRGKLLDFDLSLEQLRGHLDPTGERLGQTERLRKAWEAVVGASVSAHTQNLFLRGDELVVWLDSNIYAQQLPLFVHDYLAGLARELGHGAVKSITYRIHHRRS